MQSAESSYGQLVVPFDVNDVYGNSVIRGGTELKSEVIAGLGRSGRFASTCRMSLQGSKLRADMEEILHGRPYAAMFPPDRLAEIFRLYDELRILPVLFEEFEYMRHRDLYVYGHVLSTAALTACLAIDLYGKERAPLIGYTALTHDLGMPRLPDDILKKGIGDDRQKRCMLYGHTIVGFVLLTYYMGSTHFANCRVALEHHERGNGTGYPRGIRLSDSIIELIAVAESFDALLSSRPFRQEPFELRAALDLMWNECKLGILNSQAVKLLISYNRADGGGTEGISVAEEERGRLPADNQYVNWSDFHHNDCHPPERKNF